MNQNESDQDAFPLEKEEAICNLEYVTNMMSGNKKAIRKLMDLFLIEISKELQNINDAIAKSEYAAIAACAHKANSTASIMGVSPLIVVLKEIEDLATKETGIEKIKELNEVVQCISEKAIDEINRVKLEY